MEKILFENSDETEAIKIPEDEHVPAGRPDSSQETTAERRERIRTNVLNKVTEEMERLHPKSKEAFHNIEHPHHVWNDANEVLDIFARHTELVNNDTRIATETAIAGHDLIINYEVVRDPNAFNYGQRVRIRGFGDRIPPGVEALHKDATIIGNEELSWQRIRQVIEAEDPDHEVYTEKMLADIEASIAATYPDVTPTVVPNEATNVYDLNTNEEVDLAPYLDKDKNGNSTIWNFSQPLLDKENIPALATALGDLKYVGKVDGTTFKIRGNEEYREINELIREEIANGVDKISPERKSKIAGSALKWIRDQIGFAIGQKSDFNEIIQASNIIQANPDVKNDLTKQYGMFDNNILAAKIRTDHTKATFEHLTDPNVYTENTEAANASFIRLLKEMGYAEEEIRSES